MKDGRRGFANSVHDSNAFILFGDALKEDPREPRDLLELSQRGEHASSDVERLVGRIVSEQLPEVNPRMNKEGLGIHDPGLGSNNSHRSIGRQRSQLKLNMRHHFCRDAQT